jgi:thiamine-phosphate pyrophosphorylase
VSAADARCVVRGLYAVTPDTADTQALVRDVDRAVAGGARLVQYRNKTASAALRLEQASALKALCSRRGVQLIVNDHVDLAREIDADGVHLGKEDGAAAQARVHLAAGKLIGVSCYDSLEAARAAVKAGADYVAFGSFFPSQVKPGAVQAPVALLTRAKQALDVPVVAIGGITAENAGELVRAGADALAVISAVFAAPDVESAARRIGALFGTQR